MNELYASQSQKGSLRDNYIPSYRRQLKNSPINRDWSTRRPPRSLRREQLGT